MENLEPCRALLTFAGRKSYIYTALCGVNYASNIFAGDADPLAPIRHYCGNQFVLLPKFDHKEYLSALQAATQNLNLDCIIPLNDMDVPVLSSARQQFADNGIHILTPNAESSIICCDKYKFSSWLEEQGLPALPTYLANDPRVREIDGPVIVKPRQGQGSRGLRILENATDLNDATDNYIVQPRINGAHYNADIVRSWDGKQCCVALKKKLEMRDGTCCLAVSYSDKQMENLSRELAEKLDVRGAIDIDFIVESSGELFVLEVNARVGGLFVHSCLTAPLMADALMAAGKGAPLPEVDINNGIRTFMDCAAIIVPSAI